MDIYQRIILGTISILSSLDLLISTVWAEAKPSDFTGNSQTNQNPQDSQINITLRAENAQSFAALIQQAESLATSHLEQAFAKNPQATEISVSIMGEKNGQEAPLLFSKVSRSNWQQQPRIRQWTKYFGSSAVLLGFLKPQPQIQQATSPTFADTSVRRSTLPTSEDTSLQQSPGRNTSHSPIPAGDAVRNGVIMESRDPGIR